jgi:ATP-binding cassette, subfamily B, bacterial CvaB/MchF/RaxB
MSHFVVLKAVAGTGIIVHDPALGEKRYSIDEASKHLTGVALELTPSAEFSTKNETARLPLWSFWGGMQGAGHALAQVFALSVVLELLIIAAPFYMQLVIDEVVAKGDVDLLIVLALGFGLLTAITVTATTLRSLILLILQNTLHLQLASRLFHHLIRLPLTYFEKRHIGDIRKRHLLTTLPSGSSRATLAGWFPERGWIRQPERLCGRWVRPSSSTAAGRRVDGL